MSKISMTILLQVFCFVVVFWCVWGGGGGAYFLSSFG